MRAIMKTAVAVLLLAAAVFAQEVSDIVKELQAKPVVAPVPAKAVAPSAAAESELGITVSKPMPAEPKPAAVVNSAGAAVEKPVVAPVPAKAESEIGVTVSKPMPAEPKPAVVVNSAGAAAEKPAVVSGEPIETVTVAPESAGKGNIKGGLISLSLKEVELNNVIRLFATLSDANIIIPALEGDVGATKVDVNLKDVEWKPALQSILETKDLELFEKNPGSQVYSVRKKPINAPLVMNVKIFKLNYASVSNVSEMITSMVTKDGKISVFPSRNTIVVQSTPENLIDIQAMITSVDLPRQQVFVEAKIMELTDGASEKLGIDWQMLGDDNGGFGVGVNNISGTYDYNDKKIDGIDNSRTYSTLDNQNSTETRYRDIAGRPYENGTGVDSPARPGSFGPDDTRVTGITPTTLSKSISDSLSENINKVTSVDVSTVTRTLGATLSADDFKVVLAALKEINGSKIISNPKVIVANEEKAQIYIGSKEPNIKQETTQAQNADAVTTYNLDPDRPFFEYGIKLDVTPTINTSSNITVAISPTLSRWLRDKTVGNGGTVNTFPVTAEKTIKTIFSLASGQTAAIGGLSEATANDVDRKIPILGSIPLIGRFFSYSSKEKDQAETIIFVTVGLANPYNISMETGLPQDSTLAMRHEAQARADRKIKAEELRVLNQNEDERAQSAVQKLQDAEQKRLDKKVK